MDFKVGDRVLVGFDKKESYLRVVDSNFKSADFRRKVLIIGIDENNKDQFLISISNPIPNEDSFISLDKHDIRRFGADSRWLGTRGWWLKKQFIQPTYQNNKTPCERCHNENENE